MKQGDRTQLRILEAADQLFYRRGYHHTSISDIVIETGLSKGNITYHFKSKQDILNGIIQRRLAQYKEMLNSWEEETSSPQKRLIRFCEMLINEQTNLENFGCPIGTLTSEFAKNDHDLYQQALPQFEIFKAWLSEQYQQMGFKQKTANQKAMHLLAKAEGIAMLTHIFRDRTFLEREVKQLKEQIKQETLKTEG